MPLRLFAIKPINLRGRLCSGWLLNAGSSDGVGQVDGYRESPQIPIRVLVIMVVTEDMAAGKL